MLKRKLLLLAISCAFVAPTFAESTIGVVDFKECLDKSSLGKKEQQFLEDLRVKISSSLSEKEKELTEIYNKLNDPEYMDGLSPSAEKELQVQFQTLSEEMNRMQYENSQMATQSQFKVLQSLDSSVKAASSAVAKKKNLEIVLNKDTSFFSNSSLDITKEVIEQMDLQFEKSSESASKE